MPSLMLIDGNSIINRAFYGLGGGARLTAPDGTPTGAVYTFLNMFLRYFNEYEPDYVCVAFDLPGPTFRHKRYKDYKKSRTGMPEDLAVQMPMLKACLEAMQLYCAEAEGYEADDIIGTLSARFSDETEVYILSGDRDDFQLLNERVKQIYPKTRGESILYTPAVLMEQHGLRPDQVIDMKALKGDSSDDIPGIKGIGEKSAMKLLKAYDNLDGIIEHADEVSGAMGKKLRAGIDDARLSYELAAINLEVPLDVELEDLKLKGWDKPKLLQQFRSLGFSSLISRFGLDEAEAAERVSTHEIKAERREKLEPSLFAGSREVFIKLIEAEDQKTLLCLHDKGEKDAGVLYLEESDIADEETAAAFLEALAEDKSLVTYDAKKLYKALNYFPRKPFSDLKIAAYLAGFESAGKTSDEVYQTVMQEALIFRKEEDVLPAEIQKLGAEYKMYFKLEEILEERQLKKLAHEIEYPLAVILAEMESAGIRADASVLEAMGKEFEEETKALEEQIYAEAGHAFNVNSPKQLGEVLFDEMGITPTKKTPSGAYSTAASELEKLAPFHPIVEDVLAYRKAAKLNSTFIEGLVKEIAEDGRIHTSFEQTLTATGRLSSRDPNLQNIPMREEEGRKIRKAFIPADGCVFLDADYSQIELRLLAALSGDEHLLEAFREAKDIHKRTASSIFAVPEDEVNPAQRAAAKTVNFSIVYGISDFGLAQDLKITRKEAHQYIEGYHKQYPAVKPYMEAQIEFGREHGYVETYFGRRRYIKELSAKNYNVRKFGERAAMNAPVQGTAADIIKIAMIRTSEALKEAGLEARILLQVHDELLLEVKEEEAEEAAGILKKAMEGAADLPVPLKAEVERGRNWFECH